MSVISHLDANIKDNSSACDLGPTTGREKKLLSCVSHLYFNQTVLRNLVVYENTKFVFTNPKLCSCYLHIILVVTFHS